MSNPKSISANDSSQVALFYTDSSWIQPLTRVFPTLENESDSDNDDHAESFEEEYIYAQMRQTRKKKQLKKISYLE